MAVFISDRTIRRMARPTDLTHELADQIARFVRASNWPVTAAGAAGVPQRTFFRWMARGRTADEIDQEGGVVPESELPFWQFWQQIKRAESESEVIAVGHLMKDMPRAPTAVIQWLERLFRDRWTRGEHRQVELSGADGGPIEVQSARDRIRAKLQEMHDRGIFTQSDAGEAHERESDSDGDESDDAVDEVSQPRTEKRRSPSFA
jgi:hypothetical protein